MPYAPDHIKKYVRPISEKNKFFSTPIYDEFVVFKNSEPKVTAVCTACKKRIALYDLIEYPCATTARDPEEPLEKVINKNNDKFNAAIIIQYSDEFAFNDERFDENDITWCQIYLYDNVERQSMMIVDDETA